MQGVQSIIYQNPRNSNSNYLQSFINKIEILKKENFSNFKDNLQKNNQKLLKTLFIFMRYLIN